MARERDERPEGGKDKAPDRKLSALDRAVLAAIGDGRKVGREDDPAAKLYPDLWEWMTKTEGGKDYIMQPAVVQIQLGPEGVLVTLTHRDLRVSCGVACLHLADVFQTLQAALTCENPPLRAWGKDEPHLKKRRQK